MHYHFSSRNDYRNEDDEWDDSCEDGLYEGEDPYRCFMDDDTIEMKASSAMDCTGLIPSLPDSDEELEAYAQMYHYSGDILED